MDSGVPDAVRLAKTRSRAETADERFLDALLRALEGHPDGSLFAALAELARRPRGSGLAAVHLFEWNARREELRGRQAAVAAETPAAVEPNEPRVTLSAIVAPDARPLILTPERLTGAPAEAWTSGRAAFATPFPGESPWSGAVVIGALALEVGGRRVGLLVGEWRTHPPSEREREAFERLSARAAVLLRAVERVSREARRGRHAVAIAEFSRAAVSALNLAEALHLAARLAAEATGARGSAIWRIGSSGVPVLDVTFGLAGERERLARGLQHLVAATVVSERRRTLERVTDEALLSPEIAAQLENVAIIPMRAYERCVGAIAVYDRSPRGSLEPPEFDEVEVAVLETIADLLALVMDQAERFGSLRRAELRARELQARLAREERLATLGEMAVRVAEDARNPLASIGAFARRVHRELAESSAHREYLEIVIRECDRLERIIGAPLESLPVEPGHMRVQSLNEVVQDAMRLVGETLVRRRVRLLKRLAPDLPMLLLDVERVRIAVSNVLKQALEVVAIGGRIRVESRRVAGFVVLEIAHDGPREPGDLVEQLFVPFAGQMEAGSAIGLSVAQQVIQAHGGEVRARRETEWTAVVSLTFPIQGNEDRRRSAGERRQSRPDRRRRTPER
jgi:nitrogen-specific signal transduction histidine kinase